MRSEILLKAENCNCFAARAAARHITQLYDHCLAPLGLRVTQFSILHTLKRRGPLPLNAFAKAMTMDRTTFGRNVRPLERDGLIAIGPSASDRRAKLARLTAAGEKRLQAALVAWSKAQQRFESSFGSKRSADMRALMRAVVASSFEATGDSVER